MHAHMHFGGGNFWGINNVRDTAQVAQTDGVSVVPAEGSAAELQPPGKA